MSALLAFVACADTLNLLFILSYGLRVTWVGCNQATPHEINVNFQNSR